MNARRRWILALLGTLTAARFGVFGWFWEAMARIVDRL